MMRNPIVEGLYQEATGFENRAREIVKLAAKKTKIASVRDWLTTDEKGKWEQSAKEYLAKTADKAAELKLSDAQVNDEIAGMLVYLALTATKNVQQKKGKR